MRLPEQVIMKKKKLTVKDADKLWSELIKKRANYTCERCGASGNHPHHIMSRSHFSTRHMALNGVCLCTRCHLYIAHKDYEIFREFLSLHLGEDKLIFLREVAKMLCKKIDYKERCAILKEKLENLK
jgi:hypothetical protein